jgi:hypothetical protein
LEKELDLRNSSNSDSGSGNEIPSVDVLNDTGFFHDVLEHRREAWQSTIVNSEDIQKTDPIKDGEENNRMSEPIYRRSTVGERVILEQFKTISVLGKGTFAKVYLVYLPDAETKFYALKSMRKDVILDRASVQSINLERLIMLQVNHPFLVSMHFVFQR